jgi:tetratricopeptide (TPR) repeat protein
MKTRSPSRRVIGALLVAVLPMSMASTASPIFAQQTPLRVGQSPGPRFLVPTLVGDGTTLGFQVANAVRERIASEFDMRTLWVLPESTIARGLETSGYAVDKPLSKSETRQLAQLFSADESLSGAVVKTASGGYRVEADWSLTRRDDMVQPLPPVEAAKISDVAKLVAREFNAARKQVEGVRQCNDLARSRNFPGAIAAARKAIDAYPNSVLGRVCIANIYAQEKLGPDSMIRIAEEILAIHPRNRRALEFAADAYREKGLNDKHLDALTRLVALDPADRGVRVALARALATAGNPETASGMIDSLLAERPNDVELLDLQWKLLLSAKAFVRALDVGERLVAADTSLATPAFFVRMLAAADGAKDMQRGLALAIRATTKFPADDELAVLHVQFLRRAGDVRGALAAVNVLIARSPRVRDAWTLKLAIEMELAVGPDTLLATLRQGLANGLDSATAARYGRSLGSSTMRAAAGPTELPKLRTAVGFLKLSDGIQPNDTTAVLLGTASLRLAQRLATEVSTLKQCDLAREVKGAADDSRSAFARSGGVFDLSAYVPTLTQLETYATRSIGVLCK